MSKVVVKVRAITFGCLSCGKLVIDYPSNRSLFCSKECYGISRRLGKYGTPKTAYFVAKDVVRKVDKCQLCNSTKNLMAHHLNLDREDNRLENLIVICRNCHLKKFHKNSLKCLELSEMRLKGKKPTKVNCFMCGNSILITTQRKQEKHNFCSQNCYKEFRGSYK